MITRCNHEFVYVRHITSYQDGKIICTITDQCIKCGCVRERVEEYVD